MQRRPQFASLYDTDAKLGPVLASTKSDVLALAQWVENGTAPTQIIAARSTGAVVDRTRPLFPYPQVARHNGSGSINDAANSACALPK